MQGFSWRTPRQWRVVKSIESFHCVKTAAAAGQRNPEMVLTQSHAAVASLCERSSLKQSFCSPQNQFDFTFQERRSARAAELGQGGPERGLMGGWDKDTWSSQLCWWVSVWEGSNKGFSWQAEGTADSGPARPSSLATAVTEFKRSAFIKDDATLCPPLLPWEQELQTQCVLLSTHTHTHTLVFTISESQQEITFLTPDSFALSVVFTGSDFQHFYILAQQNKVLLK